MPDDDTIRDLNYKLKTLEEENLLLSERGEEVNLMRSIAELLNSSDSDYRLIENTLESISILLDIPYCVYGELKAESVRQIGSYSSFSNETENNQIKISRQLYDLVQEKKIYELEQTHANVSFSIEFKGLNFVPEEVCLASIGSSILEDRIFIFIDNRRCGYINEKQEILVKIISLVNDKLEKMHLASELKKTKDMYELIFQKTPSAIFAIDTNKNIINCNKKFEEITGFKKEEILNTKCFVFAKEPCERVCEVFSKKIRKPIMNKECKILTRNGEEKIVSKSADLIFDDNGEMLGAIESFVDITRQKQLEAFKEDVEKIMRHDLKTPLNAMMGFPQLMLNDDNLTDTQKEMLGIIIESGNLMLGQINSSLDIYKMEAGTCDLNIADQDILDIIRRIGNDLKSIVKSKIICIDVYVNGKRSNTSQNLVLRTDAALVYTLLTNIIKNALEASPDEEAVSINLNEENQGLVISVNNQGMIPVEIRDRFFEKFVSTKGSAGTGLGTYSSKLIANALGAEISFTTNEINGTTIFINFHRYVE